MFDPRLVPADSLSLLLHDRTTDRATSNGSSNVVAEDIARLALADPSTTLGRLQRGRGSGWLECLELPQEQAHDFLWQCIAFDPRLDQGVESRSEYYASLARLTDFDVSSLLPDKLPPPQPWRDDRLVTEVLVDLDRAGVEGAGSALLAQIKPEDDTHESVLIEMYQASEATNARLPAVLIERRNAEHLAGTVNRFFDEFPWERWAGDYPRIEAALQEVRERRSLERPRVRTPAPPMSAPLTELLKYRWGARGFPPRLVERLTTDLRPGERDQLVQACSELREPVFPFAILGILDDPGGLVAATAIIDERQEDPGDVDVSYYTRGGAAYRYLKALQAEHTLPLAREWLNGSVSRQRFAAGVLGRDAEPTDIPAVRAQLEAAWRDREIYQVCDLVDALARHPELGPFDELIEIFEGVEYSYARWRAAKMMAVSDPTFGATFGRECLWDSEEGVQDAGIDFVEPDDTEAVARVAEISTLRAEQAEVREEYWSRRKGS